jgi:hypothetical protein
MEAWKGNVLKIGYMIESANKPTGTTATMNGN